MADQGKPRLSAWETVGDRFKSAFRDGPEEKGVLEAHADGTWYMRPPPGRRPTESGRAPSRDLAGAMRAADRAGAAFWAFPADEKHESPEERRARYERVREAWPLIAPNTPEVCRVINELLDELEALT